MVGDLALPTDPVLPDRSTEPGIASATGHARRIEPDLAALTAEQEAVLGKILSGPRGTLEGPFPALLASPQMCDAVQTMGVAARFDNHLPGHQREIAIITAATHWRAEFEWYAHSEYARREGVSEAVIQAIGDRTALHDDLVAGPFEELGDRLVHACAWDLLTEGKVADTHFDEVIDEIGRVALTDLVATVGYYCVVSFTLNTFAVPLPDGVKPRFGGREQGSA